MEAPEPENFIMVQPGEFHYPFRFQLPPNLPPSTIVAVDGGRCNVQYYMEIEVFTTTKMKTVDRTSFITFMVRVLKDALYALSWLPIFFLKIYRYLALW
jgi:hypothetical protein